MTSFFDANVIDWSNINSFGTSRRRDYRGQNKVATMNPGLAHVAVAWQLAGKLGTAPDAVRSSCSSRRSHTYAVRQALAQRQARSQSNCLAWIVHPGDT